MKKFIFNIIVIVIFINCKIEIFAKSTKNPKIEALSAILIDAKTGKVLWQKDAYKSLPMASTTKIMTALVTLENADLEEIVTVSKKATRAPKVKMYLEEEEKIKLKYLLYALMLQSSNDAAIAIAEHVFGSVENFCQKMNQKAIEIGANNTNFVTPNGLDEGDHHSTAYDLAIITKYALQNKDFVKLINIKNVTVNSNKKTYNIYNKNKLLNEFEGANGVKTGFTNKAGHCFVGAAKRNNMQLISVVLASGWGEKGKKQKWIDSKEILNYGFDNFKYYNILEKDTHVCDIFVERSKTKKIPLYYESSVEIPLTDEEYKTIEIVLNQQTQTRAPIKKGDILGNIKIYINKEFYEEINLVSKEEISRHDLKTCLEKVIAEWLKMTSDKEVEFVLPEF